MSGDITAEELGVVVDLSQFEGSISDQVFDAVEEYGPVLTEAFTSMTGRAPTDQELRSFVQGQAISVESTPTLASKQLSQLVSAQSMERANDMHKFSQQYGLEMQEFTEMQQQFDDTNARLTDEISKRFTLDKMNFTLARQEMEANLTGRYNVSGTIDATSLGFDTGRYEGLTFQTKELQNAGKQLSEVYETLTGNTIGLHDAMRMLKGQHSVQADTTWTQAARESAQKYGLDTAKFEEAISQFNTTFEDEQRRAYIQMRGYGTDDKGKALWTQGYRAYRDARNDFEKVEQRRDLIWSGFLNDALNKQNIAGYFDIRDVPEVDNSDYTFDEQIEAVEAAFIDRHGYTPRRSEVIKVLEGRRDGRSSGQVYNLLVYDFGTDDAFEEEAGRLANMLNGHSMQVVEAMSGWQQAGMFLGNAAVNIGSAALAS